jgi:hypothetical protein
MGTIDPLGQEVETMSETRVERYMKEYRWTRMDGITYHIAYCPQCGRIVPPTSTRRSRAGTHGEDLWVHEHQLAFLCLKSSNRGNRSLSAEPSFPERLRQVAEISWIYERRSPRDVEELLEKFAKANVK